VTSAGESPLAAPGTLMNADQFPFVARVYESALPAAATARKSLPFATSAGTLVPAAPPAIACAAVHAPRDHVQPNAADEDPPKTAIREAHSPEPASGTGACASRPPLLAGAGGGVSGPRPASTCGGGVASTEIVPAAHAASGITSEKRKEE
jgi:hypothetical protein